MYLHIELIQESAFVAEMISRARMQTWTVLTESVLILCVRVTLTPQI